MMEPKAPAAETGSKKKRGDDAFFGDMKAASETNDEFFKDMK